MSLPRFAAMRQVRLLRPKAPAVRQPVVTACAVPKVAVPHVSARMRAMPAMRASPILAMARLSLTNMRSVPAVSLGGVRYATYGSEYQPSQRKRKRKHGFLARLRSRTGKKVLVRRRLKGRARVSH
ncbi:uncharacterized protein MJAP1_003453 [Malassezia japonica]|uniref:Large ribosomal subunit protein bL34m n=1 Tax=Malassezia japonica TaxID=223818 RepID=A0AAF0JB26_9BASI|nr:uncharacterized protein MJAP1_003453 [Malassezia japonica]WFD40467.1 hypothetical protein MJAP1_003453 [Malassezia japonica]